MFKNKRNIVYILGFIILVALVLRLFMVYKTHGNFELSEKDAKNYQNMSIQLVEKGIYGYSIENDKFSETPNAYVTPGYPAFLSVVYFFFRNPMLQITIVRILQALLGSLSVLLGFLIAKKISKNVYVGLVCAGLMAVNPMFISSTVILLTEVLSLFTLLLYLYTVIVAVQKESKIMYIVSGVCFALNVLVRPASLPIIIVPFIYLFFSKHKWKFGKVTIYGLLHLLGFFVMMSPWVIRNVVTLNSFVLTGTMAGNPILAGSYPYRDPNDSSPFYDVVGTDIMASSDTQQTHAIKRIMEGFITEPFLYLKWYTVGKISYMFSEPWLMDKLPAFRNVQTLLTYITILTAWVITLWKGIKNKLYKYVPWYALFILPLVLLIIPRNNITDTIFHIILLIGGAVGMIFYSRKNKEYAFFNIFTALMFVLLLPFIPITRYTYQIMFFFILGFAYLLVGHIKRGESKCQES